MQKLTLIRLTDYPLGMMGVLLLDGDFIATTLEDPWRENQRNISCIPEGTYKCEVVHSPKFGRTIHVVNVPGRDGILFHAGNTHNDTEGCILIGTGPTFYEVPNGPPLPGITNSRITFTRLMELIKANDEISLTVLHYEVGAAT